MSIQVHVSADGKLEEAGKGGRPTPYTVNTARASGGTRKLKVFTENIAANEGKGGSTGQFVGDVSQQGDLIPADVSNRLGGNFKAKSLTTVLGKNSKMARDQSRWGPGAGERKIEQLGSADARAAKITAGKQMLQQQEERVAARQERHSRQKVDKLSIDELRTSVLDHYRGRDKWKKQELMIATGQPGPAVETVLDQIATKGVDNMYTLRSEYR